MRSLFSRAQNVFNYESIDLFWAISTFLPARPVFTVYCNCSSVHNIIYQQENHWETHLMARAVDSGFALAYRPVAWILFLLLVESTPKDLLYVIVL